MKKIWKVVAGIFFSLFVVFMAMPEIPVMAASGYTVTYRAGNVGTFDTKTWETVLSNSGYQLGTYSVTENYIKITVKKGEKVPYFSATIWTANVKIAEGVSYFVLDANKWGPAAEDTVKRNTEYVVDYGTLVDSVEYSISFCDSVSGEQIAAPVIGYGNDGDSIICTPAAIAEYASEDTAATLKLSKGKNNQVTFCYTSTYHPGTVTETVTNTIPGDMVIVTVPGETVTNTVVNTPGNAAGYVDNAPAQDNTVIADAQVPLADGNTDSSDELTTLEDEETPLAAGAEPEFSYMLPVVLSGIFAAIIVIVVIIWTAYKKKNSGKDAGTEKSDRQK